MKFSLYISFFLLFNCSSEIKNKTEFTDYLKQIKKVKMYAKTNNYNTNVAFVIDYSLHSGLYRFFIMDLKKDKIIGKGLVCHGSCKGKNNSANAKHFSNINDSYCTSLGFSVVGKRDYSKWGKNYKYWLEGLETTNSNMKSRVVVLHAWNGVKDEEIYPTSLATSWGCPTVSIDFLDKLDFILKKEKKVLLYSFR